jgi:hypothetical protein
VIDFVYMVCVSEVLSGIGLSGWQHKACDLELEGLVRPCLLASTSCMLVRFSCV